MKDNCFTEFCLFLPNVIMLWVSYQIEVVIVVFSIFFPFNLYAIINCLKSILIGLQFSDSVYHLTERFVYFCFFVIDRRAPFNISCKAGVVVMNSFNFCLGKLFSSFISEWWLWWIEYSWLIAFIFQYFEWHSSRSWPVEFLLRNLHIA